MVTISIIHTAFVHKRLKVLHIIYYKLLDKDLQEVAGYEPRTQNKVTILQQECLRQEPARVGT